MIIDYSKGSLSSQKKYKKCVKNSTGQWMENKQTFRLAEYIVVTFSVEKQIY